MSRKHIDDISHQVLMSLMITYIAVMFSLIYQVFHKHRILSSNRLNSVINILTHFTFISCFIRVVYAFFLVFLCFKFVLEQIFYTVGGAEGQLANVTYKCLRLRMLILRKFTDGVVLIVLGH